MDKCCQSCKIAITESTYRTLNGTLLKRNFNFSCKTKDLIYLVICNNCKKEYVGETGDEVHMRMNTHRNQMIIEIYRKLKVSKHINFCSQNKFTIFPFINVLKIATFLGKKQKNIIGTL